MLYHQLLFILLSLYLDSFSVYMQFERKPQPGAGYVPFTTAERYMPSDQYLTHTSRKPPVKAGIITPGHKSSDMRFVWPDLSGACEFFGWFLSAEIVKLKNACDGT
jgi:hypothetical protein